MTNKVEWWSGDQLLTLMSTTLMIFSLIRLFANIMWIWVRLLLALEGWKESALLALAICGWVFGRFLGSIYFGVCSCLSCLWNSYLSLSLILIQVGLFRFSLSLQYLQGASCPTCWYQVYFGHFWPWDILFGYFPACLNFCCVFSVWHLPGHYCSGWSLSYTECAQ